MTFIAAIFGLLGRFAGRLLTTTLGWASTLLFGRVPQSRQIVLALVTFGSIIWAALAIGVIVPDVGAFLLAALPLPEFLDRDLVRLAMLAGALILPAVVGVVTLFIVAPADRPKGRALVAQVVRGYPLCAALSATLVILAAVGLVRWVHHRAIGWVDAHVPIIVRPGGYDRVVTDLEAALDDAGLAVDRRPAPLAMAAPGRMVARVAGSGFRSLVPDRPVHLVGKDLEVGLYPSDIAIGGEKNLVARARAAIATRLTRTAAWMTTSAEAQAIETRLEQLAQGREAAQTIGGPRPDAATTFAEIDDQLATVVIPPDEWEILQRQRLQIERDLLRGQTPASTGPGLPDAHPVVPPADRPGAAEAHLLGRVAAVAGFVLAGLDVVVAVTDKIGGRTDRASQADGSLRGRWRRLLDRRRG
jgi:hypothetical protein